MSGFVIRYHRATGDRTVEEFDGEDGPRQALLERLRLEKIRSDLNWGVISLNSDSLETSQRTHSRYFSGRPLAATGS